MIESICSNCGNRKTFDDDKLGKKYKCPSCSNTVVIEKINVTSSMQDEIVLNIEDTNENYNRLSATEKWIYNKSLSGRIYIIFIVFWLVFGSILTNLLFVDKESTAAYIFGFGGLVVGLALLVYVIKMIKSKINGRNNL